MISIFLKVITKAILPLLLLTTKSATFEIEDFVKGFLDYTFHFFYEDITVSSYEISVWIHEISQTPFSKENFEGIQDDHPITVHSIASLANKNYTFIEPKTRIHVISSPDEDGTSCMTSNEASYYRFGFTVKFGKACSIHFVYNDEIISQELQKNSSPLHTSTLFLSIEHTTRITASIQSGFGTPEFTVYFVTKHVNMEARVQYLNENLNSSTIEKFLQRISSRLLICENSKELLIVCLTCIFKGHQTQVLFKLEIAISEIIDQGYIARSTMNRWRDLNANLYNTKENGLMLRQSKLCDEIYLSSNFTERDADMWDAWCLWLFLRQKYNHTLTLSAFMGLSHVYLATILDKYPFNTVLPTGSASPFHEDLTRISGHGLVAKGFTYRIVVRSQNSSTTISLEGFAKILDSVSWIISGTVLIILALLLYASGMKSSLFWLYSELMEKGSRVRSLKLKICLPVILWSFSTFVLRQICSSEMVSNLTTAPLPRVPQTLADLAFHSKIPLLTHAYTFLMLNYTQSDEISPESMNFLKTFKQKLYRVTNLLNRASFIVNDMGLREAEKEGIQMGLYKVPADFSVLFLNDDMAIFELIFKAFSRIYHRENVQFIGNNFPTSFPRMKSWVLPNSFLADFVIQDISSIYESGIYGRLLEVRKANRIITRFNTNDDILDATQKNDKNFKVNRNSSCNDENFDNDKSAQKEEAQPRWASFIFSSGSLDQRQGYNQNTFRAFSVTSLKLVWVVYMTCASIATGVFILEFIIVIVTKQNHKRLQRNAERFWKAAFNFEYTK